MITELYRKYRPKNLSQLVGQSSAVSILGKMMEKNKVPHCLLLTGGSGVGKTTIARILRRHLNCGSHDYDEINCADFKGIDTVREIRRTAGLSPIDGDVKIWFLDEVHKMTGDAQNSFLKLLEDTPPHVYFILATTDPQKLLKTVITRSTEIKLSLLALKDLLELVKRVAEAEKITISQEIMEELAAAAEGSARKALVLLGQVADIEGEEAQLAALAVSAQAKDQAINLARALLNPNVAWGEVAAILKELKDEPESVRYLVLGYARSVLLGGGKMAPRAFRMIDCFARNFYDSKAAGLAAACWEVACVK